MSKRIITISRQCGSGGHTIGQEVAKRLGISFYDKKLIDIVSERSGLSKETIQHYREYANSSLLYYLATNLSSGYNAVDKGSMILPDQVNAFQTELIREVTDKEPCVIICRGADYILRERDDCLHVFIYGCMEDRKKRVIKEYGIPAEKAENHILERDKKRIRHYKHFTEQTWGMAQNYDICLNSSLLAIEKCIEVICNLATDANLGKVQEK